MWRRMLQKATEAACVQFLRVVVIEVIVLYKQLFEHFAL